PPAAPRTGYGGASTPKCENTSGATSTTLAGTAPETPTLITGTRESPATSEPCEPPPWWCPPPRSANSQPGAAETTTSPAFGQRTAATARVTASGWSSRL